MLTKNVFRSTYYIFNVLQREKDILHFDTKCYLEQAQFQLKQKFYFFRSCIFVRIIKTLKKINYFSYKISLKTIYSKNIFFLGRYRISFLTVHTRNMDEKSRYIICKRVFKIRCVLIDATEKHLFLRRTYFWCYLQLYCILHLHLDYYKQCELF